MFEKRLQRFKINWRSFWNGPSGPRGPISRAWNARWPYSMLLDAEGVVRYVDVHGPELEKAIEVLLAELEEG